MVVYNNILAGASGATTGAATSFKIDRSLRFNDDDSAMSDVFIESTDIDLADGENFMFVKKIIPDIKFSTSTGVSNTPAMNIVVKRRDYNADTLSTDSTSQITTSTRFTNLRTRTRQVVLRFESDDDNSVEANKKDYKK